MTATYKNQRLDALLAVMDRIEADHRAFVTEQQAQRDAALAKLPEAAHYSGAARTAARPFNQAISVHWRDSYLEHRRLARQYMRAEPEEYAALQIQVAGTVLTIRRGSSGNWEAQTDKRPDGTAVTPDAAAQRTAGVIGSLLSYLNPPNRDTLGSEARSFGYPAAVAELERAILEGDAIRVRAIGCIAVALGYRDVVRRCAELDGGVAALVAFGERYARGDTFKTLGPVNEVDQSVREQAGNQAAAESNEEGRAIYMARRERDADLAFARGR